eukprot:2613241-Amphidinium_carterae.1
MQFNHCCTSFRMGCRPEHSFRIRFLSTRSLTYDCAAAQPHIRISYPGIHFWPNLGLLMLSNDMQTPENPSHGAVITAI